MVKDVLELNPNAPRPLAGKEQVPVKLRAASINPMDWKFRGGYQKVIVPLSMPATLSGDMFGIVAGVGESGSDLNIGYNISIAVAIAASPEFAGAQHTLGLVLYRLRAM